MSYRNPTASLEYTSAGDALRFAFDYDRAMLAALKATIPSTARRFDWDDKVWMIDPQYADQCRALALQYLNVNLGRPQPPLFADTEPSTELIELRYLGSTKDRGDDERTAYGHDGNQWAFIFPERVLKQWFGLDDDPTSESTLYAVLGIRRDASDAEIKAAFKAAAKQWHPDICSEPNATEVFQRINEAYSTLTNPGMRARYDVGLQLQASVGQSLDTTQHWRPPLRCGWLLVKGRPSLGRLVVLEILQWTEIVNNVGQTLVTSWKYGDDTYTERWV